MSEGVWLQTSPTEQWGFGPDGRTDKAHSSWYEDDDELPPYSDRSQTDALIFGVPKENNFLWEGRTSMDDIILALRRENNALRAKWTSAGALDGTGSGGRPGQEVDMMQYLRDPSPSADDRALAHESSRIGDQDGVRTCLGGLERPGPYNFDCIIEPDAEGSQLLGDQRGLAAPTLSFPRDTEGLAWQPPSHPRNTYRVTVCHALIGTSIVGIATSLSLALWWSLAHGDPGSGFTLGSYVLAAFGVLVAIPGYPHSKACRCWVKRSQRVAKAL